MGKNEKMFRSKGTYVITYSGVNTIGRNSYLVVNDGRILIIDFGIGFPDAPFFGVQYITPDIGWLIKHKSRIDGLVLTHAHLDHVGGVGLLLQTLDKEIPIYGSRFTIEFLKEKLKDYKIKKKPILKVVDSGQSYKLGSFHVDFAHVTHSIPQSMAVAVNTAYGKIVYTGDFKLDPTPINESPTDVATLRKWAKSGVYLAMLDSTNAFERGRSNSETNIVGVLEEIIEDANGRVIIGMFSSLVSRLMGILEIAKKHNKKVAFTGRSLETNVKIAMRIGYLTADDNTIIPIRDISKYDDKQLIIIATGSQGEYAASLTKMARSKHEHIRLRSTDTIILSSSVIPTNVLSVQKLMDLLSYTGATIINSKLMDVHVSGHAYQEEMKDMARFFEAKYYIPVHGYPSFLFQHKKLLEDAAIEGRRVFVPAEGGIWQLTDSGLVPMKKLKLNPQYVIGRKLLSNKETMISDRVRLAGSGVVCVSIKDSKNIVIKQLGLTTTKSWNNQLADIQKEILTKYNGLLKSKKVGEKGLKDELRAFVSKVIKNRFGVHPVLIVDVPSVRVKGIKQSTKNKTKRIFKKTHKVFKKK